MWHKQRWLYPRGDKGPYRPTLKQDGVGVCGVLPHSFVQRNKDMTFPMCIPEILLLSIASVAGREMQQPTDISICFVTGSSGNREC